MESILGSLDAAVMVVSRDLIVQVWNRQAEELWGLREDETVGRHLLNLDSGIPHETLRDLLRKALTHHESVSGVLMEAVNRRGRTVRLRVTVSALEGSERNQGAMILMEVDDGDT